MGLPERWWIDSKGRMPRMSKRGGYRWALCKSYHLGRFRDVHDLPGRDVPDVGDREEHGGLGDKARYNSRGRDL